MQRLFIITAVALFLASCTALPDAQSSKARGSVATPSQYGNVAYEELEVSVGLRNLFRSDSLLSQYITKALKDNPNLQASAASLEEAGFDLKAADAGRFPSLIWNSSANQSEGVFGSNSVSFSSFGTSLDTRWEVDVWGRIKAGIYAASYDEQAAKADYRAAQESLVAQTVQAYFSALAQSMLVTVAERESESLDKTYNFTERRFESGTGSLSEVELAKSDFKNAQADIEAAKNSYEQSARALAVLTGQAPRVLKTSGKFPPLGRSLSSGVPSDLLRKRPDIQAAYLRIIAADERVKVAHKDLFPSFSLTGSYGRESNDLSNLLSGNAWSIGAGIAAPIFAGGALKAELGASNARAKSALADYRATVISALEEVENALASEHYLRRQEESTKVALTAALKAEARVRNQYESGLTDLITLLETQRRVFSTKESLVNVSLLRYQNRVALALALGKGL